MRLYLGTRGEILIRMYSTKSIVYRFLILDSEMIEE